MRVISVSYGHGTSNGAGGYSASGKLYDYSTDKNYRTGDVVVLPVEHYKSHKLYNTLAVVRMTNDADSSGGQAKIEHLTDPEKKIKPKDTSLRLEVAKRMGQNVQNDRQVDITTLPGYDTKKSAEKWSQHTRLITRTTTRGG